jgi:hypothetical protein
MTNRINIYCFSGNDAGGSPILRPKGALTWGDARGKDPR